MTAITIDIFSELLASNIDELKDFFLNHSIIHQRYDAILTQKNGNKNLPYFDLYDEFVIDAISNFEGSGGEGGATIRQWAKMHRTLHEAELALMGVMNLDLSELEDIDVSNNDAFQEWLISHQYIHQFEDSVVGT